MTSIYRTLFFLFLTFSVSAQSNDPGQQFLERANNAQKSENNDSAAYYFGKAQTYYKEKQNWQAFMEATAGLGRNYLRLDKYGLVEDNALVAFEIHEKQNLPETDIHYLELLNQMGRINWWIKGNFSEAFNYLYKAKFHAGQLDDGSSTIRAIYTDLGYTHAYEGDLDSSVFYFGEALEMSKKMYGPRSPQTADRYTDLGLAYLQKSDWEKAEDAQQKAVEINLETRGEDHLSTLKCYNNLGYIYLEKYDNDQAIFYLNKAIELIKEKFGAQNRSVGIGYMNLGAAYSNRGDSKNAVKYSKMAIENYKQSIGVESPFMAIVLVNLGNEYSNLNQIDSALHYFRKGFELNRRLYGDEHQEIVSYYAYMNDFYITHGMYDKAEEGILTSIALAGRVMQKKHLFTARNFSQLAQVMAATERPKEALRQCQIALTRVMQNFNDLSPSSNPEVDGETVSHRKLVEILTLKTSLQKRLFEETGDIQYLKDGMYTAETANKAIDILRTDYQTPDSKEILLTRTKPFYEDALNLSLYLYEKDRNNLYLASAFSFIEKSKSVLLFERIQSKKEYLQSVLPDSLAREERSLARQIAQYEERIFDLKASKDTTRLRSLETRLFQAKRTHDFLLDKIEDDYPGYFEIRHQAVEASLAVTQEALPEGVLMIDYFIGDQTVYALGISRHSVFPVSIDIDDAFSGNIEELLKSVRSKKFRHDLAYKLYDKILHPVLDKAVVDTGTLTIVPDGMLHYVPFELLITESANPRAYLLRDHTILYSHSASLPGEKEDDTERNDNYIGFSPEYSKTNNPLMASRSAEDNDIARQLVALPMAREEIIGSASIWHGEFLTGNDATESAFKERASNAGIIHIASHAIIDDDEPMNSRLVFSAENDSLEDGLLHTYELYNLRLNAQLACLSACNTGFGQLKSGEGVVSLAKGFYYAGVSNIMMSLWSVPDNSTARIMQLFNEELEKGKGKAEALRLAKLQYLEETDDYGAEPYYWAAFTLIGDNEPLQQDGLNKWYTVGIAFIALVGLVLFSRRKKNS